jgi:hypothetical protein
MDINGPTYAHEILTTSELVSAIENTTPVDPAKGHLVR